MVHETRQVCMLSNLCHCSSLAGESRNIPPFLTEQKLFFKNGASQAPSWVKWGPETSEKEKNHL